MVQSGKSITKVMRKKFLQVVVVLLVISILGWNEETVFALENETAVTADESYSETEKELESVLKVEPESDLKENKVDETNFVNETGSRYRFKSGGGEQPDRCWNIGNGATIIL